MKTVKVFSPATIGNIGPGFDVLGLAVSGIGDTIEAKINSKEQIVIENIYNADSDISKDPSKNTAGIAAQEVLNNLGSNVGITLNIHKGLPSGSGLGSSAASAVAGAFATNLLLGNKLSYQELLKASMRGEYSVSGGYFADNVAPALYGGATLTRSLNPLRITPLGTIDELIIILAIPNVQVLTRESRKVIPKEVTLSDCIHNMANTSSITAAFCTNNYYLLKNNLYDYIIEPKRSQLIPGFVDVKEAALNAGADGLTISGSGPTIFAITNNRQKALAIEIAISKSFSSNNILSKTIITKPSKSGTIEMTS
tara:strand:+ start:98 stop:1030 length:933 start_codon:yes stop_codon:yes gene_type:complete